MKTGSTKVVRCAIYTRVSTDQGLEQDFNSLDAQYEASQAHIRSQAHAGWTLLGAKYDDGGFSGGHTDRPALQRLLEDVRSGKIDVIVVYKVDRLTRSLADFAKLVELFDEHNMSFVSVTQQFNTTTSMGRLILNVLLSFAQFERDLFHGAAERAGSVRRVPAADIEALVIRSVREHLKPSQEIDDRSLVHTHVALVEVQPEQLIIQLAEAQGSDRQKVGSNAALEVSWQKTISRRRRAILVPDGMSPQHARPIRSENRATLVASIARGRRWLEELIAEQTATTDSIAKRERCSVRKVNMTISLAILAPDLVKAAIDARLPHGMGVARLADLPAEWSRQHQMLGLAAQ